MKERSIHPSTKDDDYDEEKNVSIRERVLYSVMGSFEVFCYYYCVFLFFLVGPSRWMSRNIINHERSPEVCLLEGRGIKKRKIRPNSLWQLGLCCTSTAV